MNLNRYFNSIKVRLELGLRLMLLRLLLYFNSIKVRLELSAVTSFKGKSLFQFHKGTIRTLGIVSLSIVQGDFNSIKVRLELTTNMVWGAPR